MAVPISNEKRADIIKHMEAGESKEDIAKWLYVCKRTITRIWNRYKTEGSYKPQAKSSGRKPLVSESEMSQIVARIQEKSDITLLELIEEFDLKISQSALCRRLKKLGMTYKKRRSTQMDKSAKT